MGRPKKLDPKKAVNLTLDKRVKANGSLLAYKRNQSLSELVEELLSIELASEGIAVEESRASAPAKPTKKRRR